MFYADDTVVDGVPNDAVLDADVVFACGLLTAQRIRAGTPLTVVGAPLFDGERAPVYRSVIVAHRHRRLDGLLANAQLRLGINEYGSWSGWHGLKEHLRTQAVPGTSVKAHVLTGGHVNSLEAVLDGRVDVASIDSSVWTERRVHDSRMVELQVIATTRDWPAPPISIRTDIDRAVRAMLTAELLSLPMIKPAIAADYDFMLREVDDHPAWPEPGHHSGPR